MEEEKNIPTEKNPKKVVIKRKKEVLEEETIQNNHNQLKDMILFILKPKKLD